MAKATQAAGYGGAVSPHASYGAGKGTAGVQAGRKARAPTPMPADELRTLARLVSKARAELRSTLMRHHYKTMAAFVREVKAGKVPEDLVSPGWASRFGGITRQAVHDAVAKGHIEAWSIEGGYTFVRELDVRKRWG